MPDLPDTPDDVPGHDSPEGAAPGGDTPDDAAPGPRRVRWGWLLLAVPVAVVSFLAATLQVATCSEVGCTTGPALGAGGWMVGVAGAGFVIYAVRKGLGRG